MCYSHDTKRNVSITLLHISIAAGFFYYEFWSYITEIESSAWGTAYDAPSWGKKKCLPSLSIRGILVRGEREDCFLLFCCCYKAFSSRIMGRNTILFFFLFRGDLLVSQLLKKARKKNKVLHGTPDLCIIMQLTQEANWKLVIKL